MYYVYVLKLTEDKFWVGFTGSIERIHQLFNADGNIPHWIRDYPVETLVFIHKEPDVDSARTYAINKRVELETMHGKGNVKGTNGDANASELPTPRRRQAAAGSSFNSGEPTYMPNGKRITPGSLNQQIINSSSTYSLLDFMKDNMK